MRALVPGLAAITLLAAGCGNSCQDLGERLCECTPLGTTHASCVDAVKAEIGNLNPNKDEQAVCEEKLKTCYTRTDRVTHKEIEFCSWIAGRCGKAACGLSEEIYSNLSGFHAPPPDGDGLPITPDPDDPSLPLCPR